VIEIYLVTGRKPETIKNLIERLFRERQEPLDPPPIDMESMVSQRPAHCWGLRGICGGDAKLNDFIKV